MQAQAPQFRQPQIQAPQMQQPFQKNIFEAGTGLANSVAKTQMGFSTHKDEAIQNPAQSQAVSAQLPQIQEAQPNKAPDYLSRVQELEALKNHDGAVALLREVLSQNLQDPDVHHRLAVNLLASGNVTEAISEFRIASALRPTNKDFAGDLARAMEIHKQSQQENAFEEPVPPASGKEVAAK